MAVNSYLKLIQFVDDFASQHEQIQRFKAEFDEQIPNFATETEAYPILFMSPVNSVFAQNEDSYTVTFYCFDIIQKDRKNINYITSDTNLILNDLKKYIQDGDNYTFDIIGTANAIPINNALLDYVAGWQMTLTINVDTYSYCEIPFAESPLNPVEGYDVVYSRWLTCDKLIDCEIIQEIQENIINIDNEVLEIQENIIDINNELDLKVNIADLPSNLTLYPTTAASDISGYSLLVTSISDPNYNTIAVNIPTGAITGTNQLIASLATTAGQLIGNPGEINVSTIGNIRRVSGTAMGIFYFEIYHRDILGIETLIGTSSNTSPIDLNTFAEFQSDALFNNGDWSVTDIIVLKFYGSRVGGGSNPSFQFQFGGSLPVRTIVPVPASVILNLPITIDNTSINNGTIGGVLFQTTGDTIGQSTMLNWDNTNEILSVSELNVINEIWTIELIDALTVDVYAPFNLAISTIVNVLNTPVITINDDDVLYTLGNTILMGSKITITSDIASVINLNTIRI